MDNQKSGKAAWQRLALAGGFDGRPPGGTGKPVAMAVPKHPQTLTEKFNAATKKPPQSKIVSQPASKVQIEELQKKMSQPRPTLEMNTLGSVNNGHNPEADRRIAKKIESMEKQLKAKQGLKTEFARAQQKGQLKKPFNRASGMER